MRRALLRTTLVTGLATAVVVAGQEARPDGPPGGAPTRRKDGLGRYKEAMRRFSESGEARDMARAIRVLREGLPESRPVLLEAATGRSARARALALQLLAEDQRVGLESELVSHGLRDPSARVRTVALRALTRIGEAGYPLLIEQLRAETEATNLLVAVDTLLAIRGDRDVAPEIVRLFKREKDAGVQYACRVALRSLTGRDFGLDVGAWESYLRRRERLRQAEEILERRRDETAADEQDDLPHRGEQQEKNP